MARLSQIVCTEANRCVDLPRQHDSTLVPMRTMPITGKRSWSAR